MIAESSVEFEGMTCCYLTLSALAWEFKSNIAAANYCKETFQRIQNRETFRGREWSQYNSWTKFYHILHVEQKFGTNTNKRNEMVQTFGDNMAAEASAVGAETPAKVPKLKAPKGKP